MKKLGLLVMPLMAMSFLTNCGGGSKPFNPYKIDLYKKEIEYDETGKNIHAITEYEYNDKDLVTKETKTYQGEWSCDKEIEEYGYDDHENEIAWHGISYEDDEIVWQEWMRYTYQYDSKNRITEEIDETSSDNIGWEVLESYKYKYDNNITIEENYERDGSLDRTTTYTYDDKGNLVNEKCIYFRQEGRTAPADWERIYTVDNNGCATKIENYESLPGREKKLNNVTDITYLNNLWYRPLKEITSNYYEGQIVGYTTIEREYDSNNRITLYKDYEGNDEETTPYYYYYATYEY